MPPGQIRQRAMRFFCKVRKTDSTDAGTPNPVPGELFQA